MVGGFNHNFRHNGELFHVQTEDGGRKNPRIVTQLFHGGTVLASQKQNYEEILESENLNQQVECRMQEQHKEILRRLRGGDFDEIISRLVKPSSGQAAVPPQTEASLEAGRAVAAEEPVIDLDELVFAYLAGNDHRYRV